MQATVDPFFFACQSQDTSNQGIQFPDHVWFQEKTGLFSEFTRIRNVPCSLWWASNLNRNASSLLFRNSVSPGYIDSMIMGFSIKDNLRLSSVLADIQRRAAAEGMTKVDVSVSMQKLQSGSNNRYSGGPGFIPWFFCRYLPFFLITRPHSLEGTFKGTITSS